MGTPKNADELRLEKYAPQESNNISISAEKPLVSSTGGSESGALSDFLPPSPTLSMLTKLISGLTADECAALARKIQQGEGG